MRTIGGLIFLLLCLISAAKAQVSVDMKALESFGPAQPAPRPAPVPARHPAEASAPVAPGHATAHRATHATAAAPPSGTTVAPGDRNARQPPGSVSPPPPVASVPIPAVPTEQPAAPPAVAMVPAPAPSPLPLPPPVRLVFEEGKTDLTPADEAAIQGLARAIPAPAADSINVVAYAAGKPEDPSTARRLSLSRGLAVRSVLLASGIPSAQIYVRALGATPSDGPADRVELTVAPLGTVTR